MVINLSDNASFTGGNGQLATVRSGMAGTQVVNSTITLNADGGSTLTGDILTDGGASTVDIRLAGASQWSGASLLANDIEIDDTGLWDVSFVARGTQDTTSITNITIQFNVNDALVGPTTYPDTNRLDGNSTFTLNNLS